jgi:hypothetical protein
VNAYIFRNYFVAYLTAPRETYLEYSGNQQEIKMRYIKTVMFTIAILSAPVFAFSAGTSYYGTPDPPKVGSPPVYDAGIRAATQNRLQDTDEWWRWNQRMKAPDWTKRNPNR